MQQTVPANAKKSCRSWSVVLGETLDTRTTTCGEGSSHKHRQESVKESTDFRHWRIDLPASMTDDRPGASTGLPMTKGDSRESSAWNQAASPLGSNDSWNVPACRVEKCSSPQALWVWEKQGRIWRLQEGYSQPLPSGL